MSVAPAAEVGRPRHAEPRHPLRLPLAAPGPHAVHLVVPFLTSSTGALLAVRDRAAGTSADGGRGPVTRPDGPLPADVDAPVQRPARPDSSIIDGVHRDARA